MPKTDLRPPCSRLTWLILIMVLSMASQAWAQPSGMGKGGMGGLMGGGGMGGPMDGEGGPGPGRGPKRQTPPKFDMSKATTITGQIESLGSYRLAIWRSLPGMAIQGLMLKTDQGTIEVYLGSPSYVTEHNFLLQVGDTLEVNGFKVFHKDQTAFFAAKVKKNHQTLTLLDEDAPLWKQQDAGGPGSERPSSGGNDPGQVGDGMMGANSMGRGR